jgi:hypothetical protein
MRMKHSSTTNNNARKKAMWFAGAGDHANHTPCNDLPPNDVLNRGINRNAPPGKRREQLQAFLLDKGYI